MSIRSDKALDSGFIWLGRVLTIISGLFLAVPAVFVVVLSFSNDQYISFPPKTWGVDRYVSMVTSGRWLDPFLLSLFLALLTAVATLLVVIPAIIALRRGQFVGRKTIEGSAIAPLLIPNSAYALGLFSVFGTLGILGSVTGIVMAHLILAIPLAMIVVGIAASQLPTEFELAAMTLGASRARAITGVTLRLLLPAVSAAFIVSFITSFDEAVFITFLGGAGLVTLPKTIFDSVQFGVDPAITAVATTLMIVTGGLSLLSIKLRGNKL